MIAGAPCAEAPPQRPKGRAGTGPGARRRRAVASIGAVAGLAVIAAGCGGSPSPSVANLGGTTTSSNPSSASSPPQAQASGGPSTASFLKFAHCMDSHGEPTQVNLAGGGVQVKAGAAGGGAVAQKNSPQFAAAQRACDKYLPNGGPGNLSPAEEAQARTSELALAQCMRGHGYPNFPDPTSQGVLDLTNSGIDPSSTQFQTAMRSCRGKGKSGFIRIAIGGPGPSTSGG